MNKYEFKFLYEDTGFCKILFRCVELKIDLLFLEELDNNWVLHTTNYNCDYHEPNSPITVSSDKVRFNLNEISNQSFIDYMNTNMKNYLI